MARRAVSHRELPDWIAPNEDLSASIREIWRLARQLQWAQSGQSTQGEAHCRAVERNIARLLTEFGVFDVCCPEAAYVLSAASALHDIGKIRYARDSDPAFAALDHGRKGEYLLLEDDGPFEHVFPNGEYRAIIAQVIGCHADGNLSVLNKERMLGDSRVHLPSLTSIFRLGDMLDFDRTPWLYRKLRGEKFSGNEPVWIARSKITGWMLSSDKRTVLLQERAEGAGDAEHVWTLCDLTNKAITRGHRRALADVRFYSLKSGGYAAKAFVFPARFSFAPKDATRLRRLLPPPPARYQVRTITIEVFGVHDPRSPIIGETYELVSDQPSTEVEICLAFQGPVCGLVAFDNVDELRVVSTETTNPESQVRVKIELGVRKSGHKWLRLYYKPLTAQDSGTICLPPSADVLPRRVTLSLWFDPLTFRIRPFSLDKDGRRRPIVAGRSAIDVGNEHADVLYLNDLDAALRHEISWCAISRKGPSAVVEHQASPNGHDAEP